MSAAWEELSIGEGEADLRHRSIVACWTRRCLAARPLAIRQQPQAFRHHRKLCKRANAQFLNDLVSMQFNGPFRYVQRIGYLFMGQTADQVVKYVSFARRQVREA